MKGIIEKLDEKVEELTEKLKKSTDYFNNIVSTIEKLSTDKITVLSESNFINGALTSYKNISEELKKISGYVKEEEVEIIEAEEDKS